MSYGPEGEQFFCDICEDDMKRCDKTSCPGRDQMTNPSPPASPTSAAEPVCGLCGWPMPAGETMFKYHGFSGPCPAPPNKAVQEANRTQEGGACSDGKLREIWRGLGGSVDRKNRAFIEIDLLPELLRGVVDHCVKVAGTKEPPNAD